MGTQDHNIAKIQSSRGIARLGNVNAENAERGIRVPPRNAERGTRNAESGNVNAEFGNVNAGLGNAPKGMSTFRPA